MGNKTWTLVNPFFPEQENKSLGVYLCKIMNCDLKYNKVSHSILHLSETINSKVVMLEVS